MPAAPEVIPAAVDAVSDLYAQGTPDVVISKRLGHATVAITMEIYVHVRPTLEKDYIQNYKVHPTKTWV